APSENEHSLLVVCYGGCTWETFGSAGSLLRFANLRTTATLIRLATIGGVLTSKEKWIYARNRNDASHPNPLHPPHCPTARATAGKPGLVLRSGSGASDGPVPRRAQDAQARS